MFNKLLIKALSALFRHGRLTLIDGHGMRHEFGDGDPTQPTVHIRIHDPATERQIILDPRLGAAEAFIDGRLTVEQGDVMQLAALARGGVPRDDGPPGRKISSPLARLRRVVSGELRQINHRRAARANVAHHYDLDDRLYDRFLDPWRQYSCGYWTDDTPDLAASQRAKIAHIAAKLDLKPDHHILDIGCGWGGLAIALHKLSGARVHGITLSKEQLAYAGAWAAREGVATHVSFELIDYRDKQDRFDRIVSVGMFEHVGTAHFSEFFLKCRELLKRDGVMLLHSITRLDGPGSTDAFTRKYIFPGGYIPALSETLPASEAAGLFTSDIEILRLHYAKTIRAWYDACVAAQAAIEAVYDDKFFRLWTFYLAGATAAFEHGGMANFQIQFVRDVHTLPLTRDYIAAQERHYRAMLDGFAGEQRIA